MEPLETKEIRGLSVKALGWLISSTTTIVVFIVTSYFLLTGKIEAVNTRVDQTQSQKIGDDKINDLRLQVIQSDINRINAQVEALQRQVNGNTNALQQK